ncbi:hypothetical protein SEUCBS140593_003565 [Sporothrix eucalyptigena]|uniref:DUF7702 domain-containing protein n=1 Tax=Sporothrix eucalyptigena TaxID=1812306 RepID=A0ABP0BG60_9PEZI
MGVDALSAAKLAIYIVLIQPSFYTLWKHGRTGLLGWFYLNAFCVLRIVTDAMTLHPNTGTATLILASIGLAPLLFATAGILHEARLAREPGMNNKIEWILQLQFHAIVIAGVVLVIIGIVSIEGKSNLTETTLHTNQHLVEAGAGVMVVAWLALVLWSLWSTRLRATADVPSFRGGTILLHAVIATLVFNGVRLVYAITSLILRITHPDSGFLTSTAASVCLSVVPELLVVIIFLVGGLRTRNLRKTMKTMNKYTAQPLQTGMQPMPAQYNSQY